MTVEDEAAVQLACTARFEPQQAKNLLSPGSTVEYAISANSRLHAVSCRDDHVRQCWHSRPCDGPERRRTGGH